MAPSETSRAEVQRIVEILKSAAKPMTFIQMKKATRLGDAGLKAALESGISEGAAFRWPDRGKSHYFWSHSADHAAQQAVLAIASEEALSRTKLIARARKQIPGFPEKSMQRIVMNLAADRQLQPVPAFTAGKLLIRSGTTAPYAAAARKFIEEKFRKAGFDPALVFAPAAGVRPAPPGAVDAAAQILEAIRSLEPVAGVPVSAERLRRHLPRLEKHDFDTAALELRDKERVFLSPHNNPLTLSEQERDLLIKGAGETYYVAIAIR